MGSGTTFEKDAQIGPYRIVSELGGGGMGVVYRAAHDVLDRPAAIKVLRPELRDRADAIARFLAEARTTAAIRHAGIVEVYDFGYTAAGDAFLAMELLEGQTLAARIAAAGRLSVFEAMVLARRIAAPLAVAHARGVVHRDLKPENVFLVRDPDGGAIDQVKLFDFGVASYDTGRCAPQAIAIADAAGFVLGTPAYMSPEQSRGAPDCDYRTDLYALGCILFELLAGQPPYGSGAPALLAAAHLESPVPEVRRRRGLPREIRRLVQRLLAKRADDRPRDALEVIAELDRALITRGLGMAGHPGARRLARLLARRVSIPAGALGAVIRAWRTRSEPEVPRGRSDTGASTLRVRVARPRPLAMVADADK